MILRNALRAEFKDLFSQGFNIFNLPILNVSLRKANKGTYITYNNEKGTENFRGEMIKKDKKHHDKIFISNLY